jgi:hypothetical protein
MSRIVIHFVNISSNHVKDICRFKLLILSYSFDNLRTGEEFSAIIIVHSSIGLEVLFMQ